MLNNIIRIHQERAFDLMFDVAAGTLRSRMVHMSTFLARKFEHEEDSRYSESFDEYDALGPLSRLSEQLRFDGIKGRAHVHGPK
jgi:hypothetical protein